MEWLGLLVSAFLGGVSGLWLLGVADRLRCASVGYSSAKEAALCPVIIYGASWAHIPWERLRFGQSERRQAFMLLAVGALIWSWAWWQYWFHVPQLLLWVWHVIFLNSLFLFAVIDLRWRVLPLELMYATTLCFFVYRWLVLGIPLTLLVLGGAVMLMFFGLQTWLSRGRWLASGDPILAAMIGVALGWPLAPTAIYFTYMSVIPLVAFVGWRVGSWRMIRWPFAPLLFSGAWLALVWGDAFVRWVNG